MNTQYLTFQLAGDEYGFGILRVKEILEYDTLTRVPSAPAAVRGVINLRGAVVPVVDLTVRFGLPATAVTRRTCVVIVEVRAGEEDIVMGVMVDAVSQVMDLAESDIEPPPPFGAKVRVDYLVGMGKIGKGFVLLLDIDRLLAGLDVSEPALTESVSTT